MQLSELPGHTKSYHHTGLRPRPSCVAGVTLSQAMTTVLDLAQLAPIHPPTLGNTTFNFFTRKHHCRCCGLIFCAKCSTRRIEVRDFHQQVAMSSFPIRVCDGCFQDHLKQCSKITKYSAPLPGRTNSGTTSRTSPHPPLFHRGAALSQHKHTSACTHDRLSTIRIYEPLLVRMNHLPSPLNATTPNPPLLVPRRRIGRLWHRW